MTTRRETTPIKCGGCVCLTVILVVVATVVLAALCIATISNSFGLSQFKTYTTNGVLPSSPHGSVLANGPLSMTLDVGASAIPYTITDGSGHPHVVTLPLGTKFDGVYSTATFDGVKGSTIVIMKVSDVTAHVISKHGVTLS